MVRLRAGTADRMIASEVRREYRALSISPRDMILDCGAHIGLSAMYFIERGAGFVRAVEPYHPNVTLLLSNCRAAIRYGRVAVVRGAAVPSEYTFRHTHLYLSPGNQESVHSTVAPRYQHRATRRVVAYKLNQLWIGATILKFDVEGMEYALLDGVQFPYHVQQIAVEFHLGRRVWRNEAAPRIMEQFEAQGFRSQHVPPLTDPRGEVGVWAR